MFEWHSPRNVEQYLEVCSKKDDRQLIYLCFVLYIYLQKITSTHKLEMCWKLIFV